MTTPLPNAVIATAFLVTDLKVGSGTCLLIVHKESWLYWEYCQPAWVEFQDAVNVKCVTSFKNIHTNKIQQSRPYIGGRQPVPVFQDVPYQYSPLSCPPLSVIPLRIAFVGDSLVGKTSILYSFTNNCFPDDYVGTTFDSFSTNLVYHGTCKNLLMLDTSGAKGKNEFRLRSYACAQCVVLCFNCVDRESLESCKNFWYNEVIEYCPNVPRLLVATKYDIPTLHEPNGPPMVSKDTIEATSKQMGCFSTQYCSAWTQEGLIGTFHTILSRIGS
ncbi:rho family small GTPase [Pelomyxa schiedti]|nr:rho family small GTPase [Pelomyxa schiedti]